MCSPELASASRPGIIPKQLADIASHESDDGPSDLTSLCVVDGEGKEDKEEEMNRPREPASVDQDQYGHHDHVYDHGRPETAVTTGSYSHSYCPQMNPFDAPIDIEFDALNQYAITSARPSRRITRGRLEAIATSTRTTDMSCP